MSRNDRTGLEIAVIGMSCRFPGANNTDEFWANLKNGIESIRFFSDRELSEAGVGEELTGNPNFVRARGVIDNSEAFDAAFFGYKPLEAEFMDPQVRVFSESCWEALENAGVAPGTYTGLIGLYAGANNNSGWEMRAYLSEKSRVLGTFAVNHLTDRDFLSTRIAYKLNLKGPAVTLKTACSTGLVAVDMACRGLLTGQCDIALVGAVTVMSGSPPGYLYQEGMIFSPDGHCRAFDADARGVFFSEGSGVVVLKRLSDSLEDRDNILAVVKGSAVNNDGERKGAFEAPCVEGQAEVIQAAIHMAEVSPESVTYIETHGTGTEIGDPIEFEGLTRGFNTAKKGFCFIGSVKTNFGHLDTTAGIAGFIKTVLALKHRMIPPSLHFRMPNPRIDFDNSPFVVNTALREWKSLGYPLRAGVSSFGIGGTNAHVILEEAPPAAETGPGRKWQIVALSAVTESALEKASENLLHHLKENPGVNITDAAYTLLVGREAFKHRKVWVVDPFSPNFSRGRSAARREKNHPVFMFSGQGAQYVNMGLDLYRSEPVFHSEIDRCFKLLRPHMEDALGEILYSPDGSDWSQETSEKIDRTDITQPMLFAFEYSMAKLLMHWGVRPHAMIGHSIGEYVAACLSGVFSLEDALKIVALRGKLMGRMPTGSMLSVNLSEGELKSLLSSGESYYELSLAAVNAPSHCVVSGPHSIVESFENELRTKGIENRRLHTSHAYHSSMMDPVLEPFESILREITLNKPQIPYISNLTGRWITVEEAVSPAYWSAHLRSTVRFADGLALLMEDPATFFIELGPGRGLTTFVKNHAAPSGGNVRPLFINLVRHPKEESPDDQYLLDRISQLWLYGVPIDWTAYYFGEKRKRVPLPSYPFERRIYRVEGGDPSQFGHNAAIQKAGIEKNPDIGQWFYTPSWKRSNISFFTNNSGDTPLNWLFFMDDGDLGSLLTARLEQTWRQTGRSGTITVVRPGEDFESAGGFLYVIDPHQSDHYRELVADLKKLGKVPNRIVHLWSVTPGITETETEPGEAAENGFEDRGFYSLIHLAQAIAMEGIVQEIDMTVVTDNMQEVTGEEVLCPLKATVLGPAAVIPLEYPNIRCRSVDIVVPPAGSRKEKILIDQLEVELNARSSDRVTAFRNNYRLVQAYESVNLDEPPAHVPRLRKEGVYLITGGLGGIGFEIARHLFRQVGARLILTSRSPLPQREEWRQRADTHDPDDKTGAKIRKLLELVESGAHVTVVTADVSDYEQMRSAVASAEEELGKINGVFHAAGVPGGGMIQLKTREIANRVLLPKVKGTLVLDSLFKDHSLDFLALCSSINSVLPLLGQVDYYAANAFLDAFAFHRSAHRSYTVSINWDTWQEVGIAVEAAGKWRDRGVGKDFRHPLFDRVIQEDRGQDIYSTRFDFRKHWVLNEHKVVESGKGLAPGVTYLEMARAAFEKHRRDGVVEIGDVYFFKPLMVADGEEREVRFVLKKQPSRDIYDFLVHSRPSKKNGSSEPGGAAWEKHVVGTIKNMSPDMNIWKIKYDIEEISTRCGRREIHASDHTRSFEGRLISVGPRWTGIRWVREGEREALAFLQMDQAFVPELDVYKLHPAMLDSAVGFFLPDCGNNAYIPFSYKRLTLRGPLPATFYSHCCLLEDRDSGPGKDLLKFDIRLLDEQGVEIVDIKEFTMLRVSAEVEEKIREKEESAAPRRLTVDFDPFPDLQGKLQGDFLKNGIHPSEGTRVFDRIIAGNLSQVVVSTTELSARVRAAAAGSPLLNENEPEKGERRAPAQPRPEISSVYVAPKTELEQQIAGIWQGLLGIEQVGIHDDFFELGGDSLNVVQLNNELKKMLEKDIPVAVMFRYQTIHAFTQYLKLEDTCTPSITEEEDRSEEIEKSKNRLKARMRRRE